MPILNRDKALRSLRKDRELLSMLLENVSQEEALSLRDGADGWNAVEILCHLADFESIFFERARSMLAQDNPRFPPVDQLALVETNRYSERELDDVWRRWARERGAFIDWLGGLDDEQLARPGVHPETGDMTILQLAINTVLHDIDHLEQLGRVLGRGAGAQ